MCVRDDDVRYVCLHFLLRRCHLLLDDFFEILKILKFFRIEAFLMYDYVIIIDR